MTQIKIAIADDHQMFVDGLKSLLAQLEGLDVVMEANDGKQFLALLREQVPDVVLLDMNMPIMNGLEVLNVLSQEYPEVKVLMVTMHDSKEHIQRLLKAGADGYLLKNTGKSELLEAITTVYKGGSFFSREVTAAIMADLQNKRERSVNHFTVELTDREKDVLRLIASEYTTKEIGETLHISHHTVESHRKNLISKLNVKNIAGLVRYAVEHGLTLDQ